MSKAKAGSSIAYTKKNVGLFFAASLVAVGGLIYELIIGTVSSYLLGNSTFHFSITIGLFLFGMGIGSFLSAYLRSEAVELFVVNELILGFLGGNAVVLLFALFAFSQGLFYLGFTALVLAIGALIGLEIPLLLRILEGFRHSHVLVTRVMSLDYLGSLLASLLFPLVLLPYLGLLRTALVVGFANVSLAMVILFSLGAALKRKKLWAVVGVVIWVVLLCQIVGANYIAAYFEQKLYQDEIVYAQQTEYQKIVMTAFKNDVRLYLDANLQLSSVDEYRYHEALVHVPVLHLANESVQKVLVLGGGDGMAVREVLKYSSVQQVTLVDLDPAMTELAQTHDQLKKLNDNSLQHPKVTLVHQDAMQFLQQTTEKFDLIIADLPDPNTESLAKLYSREFYLLLKKTLDPAGVFVTQATSPYFANASFWTIEKTIASTGLVTKPYHVNVPSFGEWGFVMAAHQVVGSAQPVVVDTRFLSSEIVETLFVFDKDLAQKPDAPVEVSTLFDPVILHTYEKDQAAWQL